MMKTVSTGKPRLLAEDDADVERDCHGEFGVKISSGMRKATVPGSTREAGAAFRKGATDAFFLLTGRSGKSVMKALRQQVVDVRPHAEPENDDRQRRDDEQSFEKPRHSFRA